MGEDGRRCIEVEGKDRRAEKGMEGKEGQGSVVESKEILKIDPVITSRAVDIIRNYR